MRLTVLDDDPGIKTKPGNRIKVYLNDVEIKFCLTADDEKGEVVIAVTDARGLMVAENGEVKRQTLYGIVRIEQNN
ncbi:hypothetical protein [Ewingella americana]|uniref:hypothetical protein n=1 Tax=Ewingella americana TaxID=41202 RepID=UPI0016395493|nr:hypothetical protein [Ewingella americana]QMV50948.1 hypothetical protein GXP68_05955 [Ewingella americana]